LFEKETRSPGIKACYELEEIRQSGVFVLTACADRDHVMHLQIHRSASTGGGGGGGGAAAAEASADLGIGSNEPKSEPFEYCLDLRSKLIMVEIPAELEEEIPDLRRVIESFSEQLQVIGDIRDAIHEPVARLRSLPSAYRSACLDCWVCLRSLVTVISQRSLVAVVSPRSFVTVVFFGVHVIGCLCARASCTRTVNVG
jgi:hypothetical protein